ncbi:MarR family winged helix-turn-helix transcriptional regulator [Bradyrhizobium sp. ARR65]|uniref:MarR family winged helix-turn-helix transcriptional regulator n=1 Tax=Bradyrhizobium sp. ARR65 TaxID=1040989 RepID=UPI001FD9106D|nr:MarR family winged helix-turn-helix transcriptional regulator [Bradyrhizobium sp. ARR65]
MSRLTVSKPELMPDGTDIRFRQFIHDFLAFSARVDECRAYFGRRLGISGIAYTTLISIAHLEGEEGVGVSRIAEHLHLSGAFVTIEVAKLVKAGLVKKRTNDVDRRRVLLTVTAKGRKMLDDLVSIQAPVNDALFDCLSADDFTRLSAIMARLVGCGDHAVAMLTYMDAAPPDSRRATASERPARRKAARAR